VRLKGKLDGAVGNFNAHHFAFPHVDWIQFSQNFVTSLGLDPIIYTTQINPYEDVIELFQAFQRVNGVMIDTNQDMWRYISDEWIKQVVKKGEVGSSTMPQKVNPIDFENAEGNLQMANSLWEGMGRKLAVSRLQRDLSDSTTMRNVGTGLAYQLIAYESMLTGLGRISPDEEVMREVLHENWTILSESALTVLRIAGAKDPYRLISELSRGEHIGQEEWIKWVDALPIEDTQVKATLRALTPETYIGLARKLTDSIIADIAASRQKEVV
jgi:adenylosuccinate lyase